MKVLNMMFGIRNRLLIHTWKIVCRRNATVAENMQSLCDIPHPQSFPVVGTKFNFIFTGNGARLHEYVDHRHKELGPIFYESLGSNTELVFISDPGLMKTLFLSLEGKYPGHILPDPWLLYEKLYGAKRGLLFMHGEEWLDNRRIVNKHLLRENDEKWLEIPIKETITEFMQNWSKKIIKDEPIINLESELYRLSTNVIINVLLGPNSTTKTSHFEELLCMFSESVKKIFTTTTKLYGLPAIWYQRLNLKRWREFKESVDMSLILAQKIVKEILHASAKNGGLVRKLSDENMCPEMITRIGGDFVMAAGDTTTYTTLWTLFLLSTNQKIQEEINTNGTNCVKNVLKESMRLFPVAPFLTRILPKESFLGNYRLEAGTPIIASIYTSGRDEKNFSRANEFLPYRWDRSDPRREALVNHVPSASLPFAHGSRSCIGKKIAMLQLSEIIGQCVQNFEFQCTNDDDIKPVMSQVLIPNQEIKLQITPRQKHI